MAGLYGYVSATKWVTDLELTRFDRALAYWTRQGWAPRGPIKTESRIDVPKRGQQVRVGPTTFGGIAWAQNRGVRAVEVRIDDGPWQPAQLGDAYSDETWRLWSFGWQADAPGNTPSRCGPPTTPARSRLRPSVHRARRRHRVAFGELHRGLTPIPTSGRSCAN